MTAASTTAVFRAIARNSSVLRLLVAFAAFIVSEYSAWIAFLVYAYDQGGATTAGVVMVVQLLPAAGVALLVGRFATRSPQVVLVGGYVVQGVSGAAAGALLLAGAPPLSVYVAAVVMSSAIPTTRPAQSALSPSLMTEVNQLTACNVLLSWIESGSILVAGVLTGVLLGIGAPGHVLLATAVLLLTAAVVTLPLWRRRGRPPAAPLVKTEEPETGGALSDLWRDPSSRMLVGLVGAEFVVVGALDLLLVVLAVDVLDAGQQWVGFLNTAYGLGALGLGMLSALMVGRRLAPAVFATALALGLALAATSLVGLTAVVVLLLVVGGGRALFDVSVRVLLQRSVPPERLAQTFGAAEGLSMLGLAGGAALVPALVAMNGPTLAIVGTGLLLPLAVAAWARLLVRVDEHARVPVVEIALLRQIPLFQVLPGEEVEALAQSLAEVRLEPGTVLMREGEPGDYYYAVADGEVEISQRGRVVRTVSRPGGLGEIALLRSVPRTATAVATGPVTAYRLDRESFLTALTGHRPSMDSADAVVREHERGDAERWGDA